MRASERPRTVQTPSHATMESSAGISRGQNRSLPKLIAIGVKFQDVTPSQRDGMRAAALSRREFLRAACAATASLSVASCSPSTPDRPNVIWLVMDTLRRDRCTFHNYARATTPNLERFVNECAVYTNAVTAAPWTLPSHASMFTSTYPIQHQATIGGSRLDLTFPTVAQVVHGLGYRTANFTCNGTVTRSKGLGRGFETEVFTNFDALGLTHDKGARTGLSAALDWIDARVNGQEPFFLFANFIEPHLPHLNLAREYLGRFLRPSDNIDAVTSDIRQRKLEDLFHYVALGRRSMTEDDFYIMQALYDANIAYLDDCLGSLFDYLRQTGVLDRSMVIVTSDHGENLGEHGLRDHQFSVHDTLLRVPLAIRFPDGHLRGVQVDGLVQTIDIFPTIADVLGADWEDRHLMQGQSLAGKPARDFTVSEYSPTSRLIELVEERGGNSHGLNRELKSLRTDRFKFIWANDGTHELYDLEQDPAESVNLVGAQPQTAERLQTTLESWLAALPVVDRKIDPNNTGQMSVELKSQLEALGYVQ